MTDKRIAELEGQVDHWMEVAAKRHAIVCEVNEQLKAVKARNAKLEAVAEAAKAAIAVRGDEAFYEFANRLEAALDAPDD